MRTRKDNRGFTLIELTVAIVIIGVAVAGVLSAFITSVKGSGNAVVNKQLIAIAEEMMEEILLKPYSSTLASGGSTACGTTASRSAFATVGAYNGYQTTGICDIDGNAIAGLSSYGVSVVIDAAFTLKGVSNTLRIKVTATGSGQTVVLDGFRTNYGSFLPP